MITIGRENLSRFRLADLLAEAGAANVQIAATRPCVNAVKESRQREGGGIVVLASASVVVRNLIEAGELDQLSTGACLLYDPA